MVSGTGQNGEPSLNRASGASKAPFVPESDIG